MTMIAAMIWTGTPLLIGDVAITIPTWSSQTIALPTIGQTQASYGGGDASFSFVLMAQKIVAVTDRLAIAWTGGFEEAKKALELIARVEPACASAGELFEAVPAERRPGVSLIACVITPSGAELACDGTSCYSFSGPAGAERILVGGSGYSLARVCLSTIATRTPPEDSAHYSAAQKAGALVGSFTLQELAYQNTIAQRCGGAFEVISGVDRQGQMVLRNTEGPTAAFGAAHISANGDVRVVIERVQRSIYHDGTFLQTIIHPKSEGTSQRQRFAILNPIRTKPSEQELLEVLGLADFATPEMGIHLVVHEEGKSGSSLFSAVTPHGVPPLLRVRGSCLKGPVELAFAQRLEGDLRAAVAAAPAEPV